MSNITGILFDKDGTLFDFQQTWGGFHGRFLKQLAGEDAQAEARLAEATGFDTETARFLPGSPVIAGSINEAVDAMMMAHPVLDAGWVITQIKQQTAEVEQIAVTPLAPLFDDLRTRGLKLGIATNDGIAPARRQLDRLDLSRYFDFIAGYDSGHGVKPAPGMLIAFADQLSLDVGRIAMIGDSLHDLHAAKAAGMRPVGVLTGVAECAELAPHSEVVLPHIGHLPAWLDQA